MAEATIKDLIKEIRVSNNMNTRIEEATLGATESVQRSIADLNTMLGKYFLAQNASRGDDLEAQREEKRNAKMKSGPTQAPAAATAGGGGGLSNFLQGLGGLAETAMFGAFAAGGAGVAPRFRPLQHTPRPRLRLPRGRAEAEPQRAQPEPEVERRGVRRRAGAARRGSWTAVCTECHLRHWTCPPRVR